MITLGSCSKVFFLAHIYVRLFPWEAPPLNGKADEGEGACVSRLGSHPQAFFSFRGAELVLRLNALPTPTILAQVGLYSGMLTLIVKPFLFSGWSKCVENDSLNLFFSLAQLFQLERNIPTSLVCLLVFILDSHFLHCCIYQYFSICLLSSYWKSPLPVFLSVYFYKFIPFCVFCWHFEREGAEWVSKCSAIFWKPTTNTYQI